MIVMQYRFTLPADFAPCRFVVAGIKQPAVRLGRQPLAMVAGGGG